MDAHPDEQGCALPAPEIVTCDSSRIGAAFRNCAEDAAPDLENNRSATCLAADA